MKFIGIIPARYQSSRFPGKPLFLIEGKTMIQRVYEQAQKSQVLSELYVATDDYRIESHVQDFGGKAIMTNSNHNCGTERCHEAFKLICKNKSFGENDVIINIQGDEPCINPQQIDLVASCFKNKEVEIATLVRKMDNSNDLFSPNTMKVVTDFNKKALYFSRSPIPFLREFEKEKWINNHTFFQHIGIYAYRSKVLDEIVKLPVSILEKAESLEQLRWLENGYSINVEITDYESHSVDVPEDIEKIKILLNSGK